MPLIIKDRVKETTTTEGTGAITLAGASTGFRSFADIGNANTTYYCISGGSQFEVGLGTYTASGTTLSRDTVLSNSLGTTALINFSAGTKDVFVTYPSDKAMLGSTSAVSSTGTGSVVLNSNPTFATDISVSNGMVVGRGVWQTAFSSAFGYDALESPYGTVSNTAMTGIGYNTLSSFGVGIATVTVTNGGSGYYDDGGETDTFSFSATLDYVSGPTSSGIYPTATINVESGVVTSATIINFGYGFPNTGTTVFTAVNPLGAGSGLLLSRDTFKIATNNTALGYNAGNTNLTGSNSVYLGYGATGTGSNQIVIGANTVGSADNTVVIGDSNITSTTIRNINVIGSVFLPASNSNVSIGTSATTGTITIGNSVAGATGTITLGRSSGTQIVGIATGANGNGVTKTVNIGTGSLSATSTNIISIGPTTGGGTLTFGQSTSTQTVNIATGANASPATKTVNIGTNALLTGTTNIAIGATAGTSTTTVNGLLKQQTYLVANLPTGSAGARSFVTNALSPTFGAAVAGGGAVGVPVYHDGTSWRVG